MIDFIAETALMPDFFRRGASGLTSKALYVEKFLQESEQCSCGRKAKQLTLRMIEICALAADFAQLVADLLECARLDDLTDARNRQRAAETADRVRHEDEDYNSWLEVPGVDEV